MLTVHKVRKVSRAWPELQAATGLSEPRVLTALTVLREPLELTVQPEPRARTELQVNKVHKAFRA